MESFYGAHAANISFTVKKKRSSEYRRPCSDSQKLLQACTLLSPSSQFLVSGSYEEGYQCKDRTVGLDGSRSERKQMKLKFKLGGVTHNVHTKSQTGYIFNDGSSCHYSPPCFDAPEPREKFFQNVSFSRDNPLSGKIYDENVYDPSRHAYEPVRKSKRVPKRRIMDMQFDENYHLDTDEEIHYQGRLTASEETCQGRANTTDGRQIDNFIYADGQSYGSLKLSKYGRKTLRSKNLYGNEVYIGKEPTPDDDKHKYQRKRFGTEGKNESSTSAHNQSHQSSANDVLLKTGASFIEFPDGLLAAAPKKQKAKSSEMEQQLKKAEAAQRRRLQAEKAAREAEAEAIRKILGQDSGRRKQERIKKQLNELAQAKAAKAETIASNTIRWVIGPAGTIVIFSDDIGLPGIFNSISCGYPPAREKCAGPDCTNAYKYRDSKSRLPLCSLKCYKAIHRNPHPVFTC